MMLQDFKFKIIIISFLQQLLHAAFLQVGDGQYIFSEYINNSRYNFSIKYTCIRVLITAKLTCEQSIVPQTRQSVGL